jgi:hypothetical protein
MRLPQSSGQPVSIRVISIVVLITLAAMLPIGARAATQPPLICTPAKLGFGTVTVGQSETQLVAFTNTGQSSATVSAISLGGTEFSRSGLNLPVSLAAGESVTLKVTFAPTATGWTGWTSGKVTYRSNGSNASLEFWFAGSGVSSEALTAAPSSLSFGQVAVGSSATLQVVLTNARSVKETLKAFQKVGSEFTVSGPAPPVTLNPGQSVKLSVKFAPQTAGLSGGSVLITGPDLSVPFSGTGSTIGQLDITPTTLNFGKVMIGETGMQTAVLSAAGGSVTISSAASSSSQFALPGATFPITIPAGTNVQLNVAFTPQNAGALSAKLSFSSNASDAHATEPVAGTGTTPQVSLGWSASTSEVQGYNVYRGTKVGSYTKINGSLDPNTAYTDTTVASGKTYYYAATAVNSSGQESTYSTPVKVAVP